MPARCSPRPILCLFFLLTLLAGCAVEQGRPPAVDTHGRATALYQDGQYDRAAELWLQAAAREGPNAAYWRLLAADALIRHGSDTRADELLQGLDPAELEAEERALRELLATRLLLRDGRATAARDRLPTRRDLPPAWRGDFDDLERRISERADPARRALDQLAAALATGTDRAVRERFRALAAFPGQALQRLGASAADSRARSLALLAQVARKALFKPDRLDAFINAWRYADPPAVAPFRARELVDAFASAWRYPQRVAVLLPESGRLESAATALRNGLVSGWLRLPAASRPELVFIDSGGDAASAARAYLEAVERNAGWIVGPLDRDAVEAVVSMPGRTAPVLALNQPRAGDGGDTTGAEASNAFVFALPPEQEARASAGQALGDDCRRALLLASDDGQGRRLAQAFGERFRRGGGRVVTRRLFAADATQFEALISEAMHIDRSRGRKEALESLLGVSIAFEPQPRDDLECVLLGATPRQARSIMPQFDFLEVVDLPVYATQRVYSGRPDPRADRDLNGLHLPISPWLVGAGAVQPRLYEAERWFGGLDNQVLAELFGLGLDAVRLLPYLPMLRGDETMRVPGASGDLRIDADGALLRMFSPARFEDERLVLESS